MTERVTKLLIVLLNWVPFEKQAVFEWKSVKLFHKNAQY